MMSGPYHDWDRQGTGATHDLPSEWVASAPTQYAEDGRACPATFDAFDGRQCGLADGHEGLHWRGMTMWGEYERALETEVEWNPLPLSEEGRTDG